MPFDPRSSMELLRLAVAKIERPGSDDSAEVLPFEIENIDAALPGRGLPIAALHEVTGTSVDVEYAGAPALFAAGILARRRGPVLWVVERRDLFAPALAGVGLHPGRVIYAEARNTAALLVVEEGLKYKGLSGVVAETSFKINLTASRRLQLAAQRGGTLALLLQRRVQTEGAIAAVTRWRIGPEPSVSPIPHRASIPGLGRMRWRIELTRCRGGRTGTWIMEACDATGRLGLVPTLADRSVAATSYMRRGVA